MMVLHITCLYPPLYTTQLPDILPPNKGRYELPALHLDFKSIVPHFAVRVCRGENDIRACTPFKLTLYYFLNKYISIFFQSYRGCIKIFWKYIQCGFGLVHVGDSSDYIYDDPSKNSL